MRCWLHLPEVINAPGQRTGSRKIHRDSKM